MNDQKRRTTRFLAPMPEGTRRSIVSGALLSLLIMLPRPGAAQSPRPGPTQSPPLEALSDSQWVRVSSVAHGRREARLLAHSATEIVLDLEPQPLRVPATTIDTLWERRTASRSGALVGGLLGAGIGVLIATQAVEKGETASADWVGVVGVGGAVGGALVGALVGRAFPKWHRLYSR